MSEQTEIALIKKGNSLNAVKTHGIKIPEPTAGDIEWAVKLEKSWGRKKTTMLFETAMLGKVWRTAFLLELSLNNKVILDFQKKRDFRTPLAISIERGHLDIVTLMVQNDVPIDDCALSYAYRRKDEAVWRHLFLLGVQPEEALRVARNNGGGTARETLYNIIREKFPARLEEFRLSSAEIKSTANENHQDMEAGLTWEKNSSQKITSIEKIKTTTTTIQTIFNFAAHEVHTLFTNDNDANSVMSVRKFNEFESDESLKQAFNTLKKLGGKPSKFTHIVAKQKIAPKSLKNN